MRCCCVHMEAGLSYGSLPPALGPRKREERSREGEGRGRRKGRDKQALTCRC